LRAIARRRSRGADQTGRRTGARGRSFGIAALPRAYHPAAPRAACRARRAGGGGRCAPLLGNEGDRDLWGAGVAAIARRGGDQAAELARVVETSDFERRLRKLEEANAARA